MNIEEHINNLKKYIEEDFAFREPIKNMSDFDKYCYGHCKDIEILLTAYEKEKEKNKELTERVLRLESDKFWDNVVSKDKLKERIEEYENKIKKIRSKKLINEPEDTINITRYVHYISVLQSLLKEE